MERIIDGILFTGQRVDNCFDVRTWVCNGVMERSARPVIEWEEVGPYIPPLPWDEYIAQFDHDPEKQARYEKQRLEEEEEKRLKSLKKSASRAKTMCRRFIISEGFDEMLTLTYRENQRDRALCKRHFKEWVRRMKRALGSFRYCASFEAQERGSMHVHCATNRLPKHADYKGVKIKAWELGTKIWRDIIGAYEFVGPLRPGEAFPELSNGLCFVGAAPSKWGGDKRRKNLTLAKMANYVSKYILKDFDQAPEESNRYSRSNGKPAGDVYTIRMHAPLCEVIAACFEVKDGDVMVSHRVGKWSDSWWLCTEADIKKPACAGL